MCLIWPDHQHGSTEDKSLVTGDVKRQIETIINKLHIIPISYLYWRWKRPLDRRGSKRCGFQLQIFPLPPCFEISTKIISKLEKAMKPITKYHHKAMPLILPVHEAYFWAKEFNKQPHIVRGLTSLWGSLPSSVVLVDKSIFYNEWAKEKIFFDKQSLAEKNNTATRWCRS